LAHRRHIPKLFSKEAEIPFAVEPFNALDDTLPYSTIVQRYGNSLNSLQKSIKNLAREILERLKVPVDEMTDIDPTEDVSAGVTREFQHAHAY
jgi:hypothetical protein